MRAGRVALLLLLAGVLPAPAGPLAPGDILLLTSLGQVRRFEPTLGGAQVVSGPPVASLATRLAVEDEDSLLGFDVLVASTVRIPLDETGPVETVASLLLGSGALPSPTSLLAGGVRDADVDEDGQLWLANAWDGTIVRIDPATGDRSVVVGPGSIEPVGLAFEPGGTLLVLHHLSIPFPLPGEEWERIDRLDPLGPTLTTILPELLFLGDASDHPPYDHSDITVTPSGLVFVSIPGTGSNVPRIARIHPGLGVREAISGLGIGTGPEWGAPMALVALSDQELLVFDADLAALVRVDFPGGDRTIVSGPGAGSGPELIDLVGVTPAGTIVARALDGIVTVDPVSGDRTLVRRAAVGEGPSGSGSLAIGAERLYLAALLAEDEPWQLIAVDPGTGDRTLVPESDPSADPLLSLHLAKRPEPDGRLLALAELADAEEASVLRIDPETRDQEVISGPGRGSGPLWDAAADLVSDGARILVLDHDQLFAVDPATGDRSVVSGAGQGTGNPLVGAAALVVGAAGELLVAAGRSNAAPPRGVWSIDPVTGDRTPISIHGVGSGPSFEAVYDLDRAGDGSLLVIASNDPISGSPELYRIDPTSGDRTLVARGLLRHVAVVPEPAQAFAAAAALATLAGCAAMRRRFRWL